MLIAGKTGFPPTSHVMEIYSSLEPVRSKLTNVHIFMGGEQNCNKHPRLITRESQGFFKDIKRTEEIR